MARDDRSDDERWWCVHRGASGSANVSQVGACKWYSEKQANAQARRLEERRGAETEVVNQWERPDPEEVLG